MTNEQYLVLSYFVCATLSVLSGGLAYLFLRRPFAAVADATGQTHLRSALKKLLPIGLLLPALLGFVSVSYSSCTMTTYEAIVQNRTYLLEKNQEQVSSILFSILAAVLIWNVVVICIVKYVQDRRWLAKNRIT